MAFCRVVVKTYSVNLGFLHFACEGFSSWAKERQMRSSPARSFFAKVFTRVRMRAHWLK